MVNNRKILNPLARKALDKIKYETAADLGLIDKINNQGWSRMTTGEVGKIGGNMVKKMVQQTENRMAKHFSEK